MKITREFFNSAYPINKEQFVQFQRLHSIFLEENQKINLSAIRDNDGIWIKHFFDSLLSAKHLAGAKKIIDLGSGGGFPLLPLAIIFPEKQFYGVESVAKKCQSLKKFITKLNLQNIEIFNERAETIAQQNKEKFDTLTARAFANFPVLLEIGLPLLQIGGTLVAFRGPEHNNEDFLLIKKMGAKLQKRIQKKLPSGEQREIWLVKKTNHTNPKFPRAIGVPKKKPLKIKNFT